MLKSNILFRGFGVLGPKPQNPMVNIFKFKSQFMVLFGLL